MKKGYSAEYDAKKKLMEQYGKYSVVKTAIGQNAPDYIVFTSKAFEIEFATPPMNDFESITMVKGIEIKSTQTKKYYPHEHDIKQVLFLEKWQETTNVPVEYYVRTIVNHKVVWEEFTLEAFKERYVKTT